MVIKHQPLVGFGKRAVVTCLRIFALAIVASGANAEATGPTLPFSVTLVESGWQGAPALQSFAAATHDGKWLLIGGRTTGLHGKQESGDEPGPITNFKALNRDAWVVEPGVSSIRMPLGKLAPDLAESLAVTNAQFVQVKNKLYIVGGYGRLTSETIDAGKISDNATFGSLTVIDVPETIERITAREPAGNAIRQSVPHPFLQVTGGELAYHQGVFYLVFGQNFTGNYTQQGNGRYTYQVRTFRVIDDGVKPRVLEGPAFGSKKETPSYRRRDLNLVPSRSRKDDLFWTVYGGVFTPDTRAWRRPVYVRPDGADTQVFERGKFQQQMSQYDCATLPLWSDSTETNYTLFFGGISEVYPTPRGFRRDLAVPFIREVTCVQREPGWNSTEFLVTCGTQAEGVVSPLELPALLGASAQFIPLEDDRLFPHHHGILHVEALPPEPTLVGHFYGGIRANRPNGNFGSSAASHLLLEVYVSRIPSAAIPVEPPPSKRTSRECGDATYLPRIHFKGTFVCNSGTGNNNDVRDVFTDVDTIEFTKQFKDMPDADIRAAMFKKIRVAGKTYINAGWNPLGDLSAFFRDAEICSVRRTDGVTTTDDPLVGKYVNIIGENGNAPVIVMPDPQGGIGSQLVIGGLSIGDNPEPGIPMLKKPASAALWASHNTRAFTRWIGVRNWAPYTGEEDFVNLAATWQFAIPGHALNEVHPPRGSVLEDLFEAAHPHGLLVQFTTYQVGPGMKNQALLDKFARDEFVSNPAIGFLVGSILVRRPDDLVETAVNGRRLEPKQPKPDQVKLGMAAVTIDSMRQEVTLNLIDGIPEYGYKRPQKKVDLGDLYLGVTHDGRTRMIGRMVHAPSTDPPSYGYERYETTGGLVDFSYAGSTEITHDILRNGRLVLFNKATVWLEETDVRIESDDHVNYVGICESKEIRLHVMRRDLKAVELFLWEYAYALEHGDADKRTNSSRKPVTDAHRRLLFPRSVLVPHGQPTVSIPVTGIRPGPSDLVYTTRNEPPPGGSNFPQTTGFFTRFRVMPDDDFRSAIRDGRVSTEFIYKHVFRYYSLVFPAMGEKIMHFNARHLLENGARGLVDRTEPQFFPSTLYMPRSRDLSAGKQTLLRKWADQMQPPADSEDP